MSWTHRGLRFSGLPTKWIYKCILLEHNTFVSRGTTELISPPYIKHLQWNKTNSLEYKHCMCKTGVTWLKIYKQKKSATILLEYTATLYCTYTSRLPNVMHIMVTSEKIRDYEVTCIHIQTSPYFLELLPLNKSTKLKSQQQEAGMNQIQSERTTQTEWIQSAVPSFLCIFICVILLIAYNKSYNFCSPFTN